MTLLMPVVDCLKATLNWTKIIEYVDLDASGDHLAAPSGCLGKLIVGRTITESICDTQRNGPGAHKLLLV